MNLEKYDKMEVVGNKGQGREVQWLVHALLAITAEPRPESTSYGSRFQTFQFVMLNNQLIWTLDLWPKDFIFDSYNTYNKN